MTNFKVGFGKAPIKFTSADFPIREFAAQLDELACRVMLVRGTSDYALVSFDLTSLRPTALQRYRQLVADLTGIAIGNVWITVTHTFAAPHLPSTTETTAKQVAYQLIDQRLVVSLTVSCQRAIADLQAVTVGRAEVNCPINVNRNVKTPAGWWLGRNVTGESNHQLRVLAFQRTDGTTNVVINYDLQPSVLDHMTNDAGERVISADVVGAAVRAYEENRQVAIFLPGAAGDQRPLFTAKPDQPFAVAKALVNEQGAVITAGLHAAVAAINNWLPVSRLRLYTQVVTVPTQVQKHTTFELKPTHRYSFEATGQTTTLHLMAVEFNHYLLVGTEPELNSHFGDQCREQLNDPQLQLATLVNGAAKYLPEPDDFERVTYQAMNTQLGRGASAQMLTACRQLKQQIEEDE
ncbi:hypothetical protein [Lactiplantibacillus carotarum]|uniref:hypothetical protein n=1 Tax=Lactiplantibacillus carotarum TaxID=2993456 RepID=UPI00298F11D6|nr:hypothetical protein [Lactiplantibacillus carotarum]